MVRHMPMTVATGLSVPRKSFLNRPRLLASFLRLVSGFLVRV